MVAVILRGVNVDGAEYLGNGESSVQLPTIQEIDRIHSQWGANFLRIALSSDFVDAAWSGTSCPLETYDSTYKSRLTADIAEATADHMLVLLEVVSSNPNCYWGTENTSLLHDIDGVGPTSAGWSGGVKLPLPGADDTTAMRLLAQAFGSNPLVAFEPYNEPFVCANGGAGPCSTSAVCLGSNEQANAQYWANGGYITNEWAPGEEEQYEGIGMNMLAATVHAYAPASLVFVDGNCWSTDPGSFGVLSTSILPYTVFVQHFYPCQTTCTTAEEACSSVRTYLSVHIADSPQTNPTVFDEFGWPQGQGTPGLELGNVLSYLASYNQQVDSLVGTGVYPYNDVGWAAYQFNIAAGGDGAGALPWSLDVPNSGYVPNSNGQPVYNTLMDDNPPVDCLSN